MTTKTIATYDFDEDAMGLGDFIQQTMASLPDDEVVVYVTNQFAQPASAARFERQTLTDGSTVVNLVIEFDE